MIWRKKLFNFFSFNSCRIQKQCTKVKWDDVTKPIGKVIGVVLMTLVVLSALKKEKKVHGKCSCLLGLGTRGL